MPLILGAHTLQMATPTFVRQQNWHGSRHCK